MWFAPTHALVQSVELFFEPVKRVTCDSVEVSVDRDAWGPVGQISLVQESARPCCSTDCRKGSVCTELRQCHLAGNLMLHFLTFSFVNVTEWEWCCSTLASIYPVETHHVHQNLKLSCDRVSGTAKNNRI